MKIDREFYTSHIKDNEKLIEMRRILDKIENVLNNHTIETTDFLDPYERYLGKSIINRFEVNYIEYGGLASAERKIFIIFPYYMDGNDIKIDLSFLRLNGDLEGLSHKDYLGAILNLGIKRTKVGDILVHRTYGDFIVKQEIGSFLLLNLERIGNRNVKISEINSDELTEPEEWEPIDKPSREINVGDIISTKGHGRAKLVSIDGLSKKGRYNSTIRILT
jgi:RNA-binding protein YlmH